MIKLNTREMKYLSRILTVILCCVPAFSAGAAGTVATTSGSNLTAYNPSDAYNNQWATMSNGRYDNAPSGPAKADFGNCNALVLRCAQPKCGGGGCTDYNVAASIVAGCVKSNDKCSKYGDDLVNYMTGQLVASSNAKLNEQQAQVEMARAQAEAQAAAAAAANSQSAEQIAAMQSQMQQMQQQMYQQQQESAQQLQEALAQQQAQSQAALNNMKTAATEAAMQTESGVSAYQQEAINRGVAQDVLTRQKLTGQIMTAVEDMNLSLKAVETAMKNAFDYAECSSRGDNCKAPKRVKKWRELATGFIEPYDNAFEKLYDALESARIAGVDLSQIYAMLDNACNQWSQYLCPGSGEGYFVTYAYTDNSGNLVQSAPRVCKGEEVESILSTYLGKKSYTQKIPKETEWKNCRPCTWLKSLDSEEAIYEGWVGAETLVEGNTTVVACGSASLDNSPIYRGRARRKKGVGVVSLDQMERWLNQVEPSTKMSSNKQGELPYYCTVTDETEDDLRSAAQSRVIKDINKLCVEKLEPNAPTQSVASEECSYIAPTYGICDTHQYNYGTGEQKPICPQTQDEECNITTENMEKIKEIIGLKTTVISQQMYKQYEYLKATLRRFEVLLKKATLTADLEAAGAKDGDGSSSSSSGGLAGSGIDKDKEIVLPGAENCWNSNSRDDKYKCLQNNLNLIKSNVSTNKQKSKQQLDKAVQLAKSMDIDVNCSKYNSNGDCLSPNDDCKSYTSKENILKCANRLSMLIADAQDEREDRKNRNRGWGYQP